MEKGKIAVIDKQDLCQKWASQDELSHNSRYRRAEKNEMGKCLRKKNE